MLSVVSLKSRAGCVADEQPPSLQKLQKMMLVYFLRKETEICNRIRQGTRTKDSESDTLPSPTHSKTSPPFLYSTTTTTTTTSCFCYCHTHSTITTMSTITFRSGTDSPIAPHHIAHFRNALWCVLEHTVLVEKCDAQAVPQGEIHGCAGVVALSDGIAAHTAQLPAPRSSKTSESKMRRI